MAIDPSFAGKAAYVLGWANILGLLLVLFSCRCVLGHRISQKLVESNIYKKFYRKHCYFWWFFMASVAAHAIITVTAFGNQFS